MSRRIGFLDVFGFALAGAGLVLAWPVGLLALAFMAWRIFKKNPAPSPMPEEKLPDSPTVKPFIRVYDHKAPTNPSVPVVQPFIRVDKENSGPRITLRPFVQIGGKDDDDDDDDYREFVESIWQQADVTFSPVSAEVNGRPCSIVSLASREAGSIYVNFWLNDEKKTFVADRHEWRVKGQPIDSEVFEAILDSVAAAKVEAPHLTVSTIEISPEPEGDA